MTFDFAKYRSDDITKDDTWETLKNKAVSKSLIIDFLDDPGTWKAFGKKQTTSSMKFGSLFDELVTNKDFDQKFIVSEFDNYKSNKAKEWKQEVESSGMIPLTRSKLDEILQARQSLYGHKVASELLFNARFQVPFRHTTKHPFDCKGLIDIMPEEKETLVDLKTCSPSVLENERSLQRHIFEFGYHIQAGAYLTGWNISNGEFRTKFKFIFVTNAQPFKVAVINLPYSAISLGADRYFMGVDLLAECFKTNRFPSKWDNEINLDLPSYAYDD